MSILQVPYSPHELHRLEEEAGIEFVGGQIVEKPVSFESAEIEARITALLFKGAEKAGTAKVLGSAMSYKCYPEDPGKFRKPDVSVIRRERVEGIDPQAGSLQVPADLVVEVISPTDLSYDVDEKVQEYLEHGFGNVWVVYPNTRSVAIYRSDGMIRRLHEKDEITCEDVLPGFACKVAEFFG
jgi:Uma2 family endonuclease